MKKASEMFTSSEVVEQSIEMVANLREQMYDENIIIDVHEFKSDCLGTSIRITYRATQNEPDYTDVEEIINNSLVYYPVPTELRTVEKRVIENVATVFITLKYK